MSTGTPEAPGTLTYNGQETGYEIFTDRNGKRRLKIAGRSGFPIVMLEGETPQVALDRYEQRAAENKAKPKQTPAEPAKPAGDLLGALPGNIAEKLKAQPPKPEGDPPPRRERQTPGTMKERPSIAELQKVLEELLVLPAIPFGMPVQEHGEHVYQDGQPTGYVRTADGRVVPGMHPRCEYCRDHFITQGPATAAEIAKMAEQSEPLRRWLERLHATWAALTATSVIGGYLMKPALHHVIPAEIAAGVAPIIDPNMPPRQPRAPRRRGAAQHAHGTPGATVPRSPEAA